MPAISEYTKLLQALRTLEDWQDALGIQPLDADLETLATPTAWRMFYSDGSQVIQQLALGASGTVLQSAGASAAPTFASLTSFSPGMVMPYAGTSAPSLWLFAFGQNVSRTTYAALFDVLGTTYGSGDGTTFGLPDLRGRVVAGKDNMGGSSANRLTGVTGSLDGDVLGAAGGAETHTLTTAQMPAHTHSVVNLANTAASTGSPTASTSGDGNVDYPTTSAGGGEAHPNVQPTLILNYVIYAGV